MLGENVYEDIAAKGLVTSILVYKKFSQLNKRKPIKNGQKLSTGMSPKTHQRCG